MTDIYEGQGRGVMSFCTVINPAAEEQVAHIPQGQGLMLFMSVSKASINKNEKGTCPKPF